MRTTAVIAWAALTACSPPRETSESPSPPVVSVTTAAPTGQPLPPEPVVFSKKGELGKVVSVPRSKTAPEVDARALVWRARPDETFALALRYGPPLTVRKEKRGFGDSDAYLSRIDVELTSPSGKKEKRSAVMTKKTRPGAVNFWPDRTLFVEVAATGARIRWPAQVSAPWSGGALPNKESGIWHVGITAVVTLPQHKETFSISSGLVPFDVQSHHPKRRDMMAAAEPERVKAGASNKHEPSVEGGFVADTLIQLDDDKWVARFAKPAIWAFALTSVYLSPEARVLNVETIDISTCIAKGMRIDTPSGPRPVEDLEVGDPVWGWSFSAGRVVTHVRDVVPYAARPTVWLGPLQLSPTHPVWRDGAWQAAGNIPRARPGADARVYRLTVGAPHTYFAEGVLVHNKDRMYTDNLDDPWVFMWDPKKEWWK